MQKLTGKTRYRIHTRIFQAPKIVLQVQETCEMGYPSPPGHYGVRWRDATLEDLPILVMPVTAVEVTQ